MTLKEKIDEYKLQSAGKVPPEAVQVMQRSTADLQATVSSRPIPQVGDVLPSFELTDSGGKSVFSDHLLSSGPLIITFFRGMW